ncbi:unnamed protein product, partial [Scytosiphon promiscuus]
AIHRVPRVYQGCFTFWDTGISPEYSVSLNNRVVEACDCRISRHEGEPLTPPSPTQSSQDRPSELPELSLMQRAITSLVGVEASSFNASIASCCCCQRSRKNGGMLC